MTATVYALKKVEVSKIDGVEIRDTEGGQMIRFIVPGRLCIGEYILLLADGRRIKFATWEAVEGSTTERTIFHVPMIPAP